MDCCCVCIPDTPVEDPKGRIRTFHTNHRFQVNMMDAPCSGCSSFFWFLGQFVPITCGVTQYCLRRKALEGDMSKYQCCQGYVNICCFTPGTFASLLRSSQGWFLNSHTNFFFLIKTNDRVLGRAKLPRPLHVLGGMSLQRLRSVFHSNVHHGQVSAFLWPLRLPLDSNQQLHPVSGVCLWHPRPLWWKISPYCTSCRFICRPFLPSCLWLHDCSSKRI